MDGGEEVDEKRRIKGEVEGRRFVSWGLSCFEFVLFVLFSSSLLMKELEVLDVRNKFPSPKYVQQALL